MLSWFHQLERASSVAEVMNVCREYAATWTPEDLARLPKDCRPSRLKTHEDLEALHGCLVDEYRRSRLGGSELAFLQAMTSFVVRASVRVAQLQADAEEPARDPGQPTTETAAAPRRGQ